METILKKGKSAIFSAILKHGLAIFKLEILEYCEKEKVISREQYFIDLFQPEYNILKKAGSLLGFRHSEKTKKRMK